jgi:phosphate:Na+ symporter
MLIGFVNAGMMTFTQSIGVIMGANIGTTMTGFIISLKASQIMFPILIAGFLLNMLGKSNRVKYLGLSLLGLGLVFLGLETMAQYVKPLKDSVSIYNFFVQFSTHPGLAILAGMLVTFIIQSSSAALGLIITLGAAGLIGVEGAFGLVLGSNIGTTITAQLAAIGGKTNAKRVALTHTLFNVFGVLLMYLFIETGLIRYYYELTGKVVGLLQGTNLFASGTLLVPASMMALFIAFMHAIFNILNTLLLLPLTRPLETIVKKVLPSKKEKKREYLEPHLLDTPAIALDQTVNELSHMLQVARKMVKASNEGLFTADKNWEKKFEKREDTVDSMREDVIEYLVQLTQRPLTAHESVAIPKLIHAVNDIERIGDLSQNIMEQAHNCRENKIKFSAQGKHDLQKMHDEIETMIELTHTALKTFDPKKAQLVLDQEVVINKLEKKMRASQIKRVQEGQSRIPAGISFLDILTNLERIGDHLTNIAEAVIFSNQ